MITVEFYSYHEWDPQKVGAIHFDGQSYRLEPEDSPILQEAVKGPVPSEDGSRRVMADEGEAFMAGLQRKYSGSYLRATAPVKTDVAESQRDSSTARSSSSDESDKPVAE